ncbi:hypothetical protein [Paenibacillus lutrae]|uniref:Type II secretion system protein GspF domain-containing protein n=1 Tax=Paenibacillus lutrae TaxID=2078573 RepID=A0A7X3FLW7_9BACL|nr:hypothetical protein [Paenibacillus lutrae]MVP02128.1 hypothetical protein [Paenibacillus lutrae]
MIIVLNFIIRSALHMIVLYGLWLLISPVIEPAIRQTGKAFDNQVRLRMRKIEIQATRRKKSRFYQHIDDLLYIVKRDYEPGISFIKFVVQTLIVFISIFGVSLLSIGEVPNKVTFNNPFQGGVTIDTSSDKLIVIFPLVLALCLSVVPYLFLRYRYEKRVIKGSYDLLDVVKVLSKHTNFQIDVALTYTANLLPAENVLKRPIELLSNAFANYANEKELQQEVHRFSRTVGTTFAANLASDLLYLEREGGSFLRESLLFLNDAMEQQRSVIMQVKSGIRDAIALGSYGNILVLGIMSASMAFLLKPNVYIQLQFQTKVGLSFITTIFLGIFISFVISTILSRPKLDYH